MTSGLTDAIGRPNRLADVANTFMNLPEDARNSLAERTPKECFGSFQDCINAVCEKTVPRRNFEPHISPLYSALTPHARSFGNALWMGTMKGPMVYFVVSNLRDMFCQEPPPAAMTVAATVAVVAPAPKPAAACVPGATASVSAWTILGEMAIGGLFLYLFRGKIPQFSTPSGATAISPYSTYSNSTPGA